MLYKISSIKPVESHIRLDVEQEDITYNVRFWYDGCIYVSTDGERYSEFDNKSWKYYGKTTTIK